MLLGVTTSSQIVIILVVWEILFRLQPVILHRCAGVAPTFSHSFPFKKNAGIAVSTPPAAQPASQSAAPNHVVSTLSATSSLRHSCLQWQLPTSTAFIDHRIAMHRQQCKVRIIGLGRVGCLAASKWPHPVPVPSFIGSSSWGPGLVWLKWGHGVLICHHPVSCDTCHASSIVHAYISCTLLPP